MDIGFSTGSLALGDFRLALEMLADKNVNSIELSSLRESELDDLMSQLEHLDLSKYKYISIHAPSKLQSLTEKELIQALEPAIHRGFHIVVHPDIITDFAAWKALGNLVCIENMDKRKPIGRTALDMEYLFDKLPAATFCFDIAHAKQVDPTMQEAFKMLQLFGNKLVQIHLSEVNSNNKHEKLNFGAIMSYQKVAHLIPKNIPIILESPGNESQINDELKHSELVFSSEKLISFFKHSVSPTVDIADLDFMIKQSTMFA